MVKEQILAKGLLSLARLHTVKRWQWLGTLLLVKHEGHILSPAASVLAQHPHLPTSVHFQGHFVQSSSRLSTGNIRYSQPLFPRETNGQHSFMKPVL